MAQYGLMTVMNNAELQQEERNKFNEENREVTEIESQLSAHIQKAWEINRWAKERIEDEMLKCLRQRNGEYDHNTIAEIAASGGSDI
jgi:hypothetical protein